MSKIRTSQKYKSKDSPLYWFLGAVIGVIMLPFWLLSIAVIFNSKSGFINPIAVLGIAFNAALLIAITVITYKKLISLSSKTKNIILVIIVSLTLMACLYIPLRYQTAINYMKMQIERLKEEEKGNYQITDAAFITFNESSLFAITVIAREVKPKSDNHNHIIEIDFPWIPLFFTPSHRI